MLSGEKFKDEHNDLMQSLDNFLLNSLFGVQIRKKLNGFYKSKSERPTQTKHDENVLDYWRSPNANYVVKLKKEDGLDGDNEVKNTLPSHLGAFLLSNIS